MKRKLSALKDIFSMFTAAVMITSGAGMSVYSLVCYGDIRTGVLFYVTQALIYAGTLLGVNIYWNAKVQQALQEMELVLTQDAEALISEPRSARQPAARQCGEGWGANSEAN